LNPQLYIFTILFEKSSMTKNNIIVYLGLGPDNIVILIRFLGNFPFKNYVYF